MKRSVRISPRDDLRVYEPNDNGPRSFAPVGNRARAQTKRPITDIREHLHAKASRAMNKAEKYYGVAMDLRDKKPDDGQNKEWAVAAYLARANMHLSTAWESARALDMLNLQHRAEAIDRRARTLRPTANARARKLTRAKPIRPKRAAA